MRLLVTGGAGYIGSHTCLELLQAGHEVVVVDNLSNSSEESLRRVQALAGNPLEFHKVDLLDREALDAVFAGVEVDAVIHFAGLKAVGESMEIPLRYYHNNVTGTLILCEAMKRHSVMNLVFSSSATVYGDPRTVPITEDFPLDPTNPDKSTWYPSFMFRTDSDGEERLFPVNLWLAEYWGDWDQNGTPDDLCDDLVVPIVNWRQLQAIGSEPLPIATDDNSDGKVEINRPEEMLAYMALLKGNDSHGQQIAANPVLVKGNRIWYEDPGTREGVGSFEPAGTGIWIGVPSEQYAHIWGMDHNVLPATEAWGSEGDEWACGHCHFFHNGNQPTKVFDRLILVDPYDVDGQPVYKTVRELTGLDPI